MSTASRRLAVATVLAAALVLSACASGEQQAVAPEAGGSTGSVESATPRPIPSDLPTEEPTEEVLEAIDEGGQPASYPQDWPQTAWPAVAVPASPTARLAVTCAQLLEAAGRPAGVSLATPQPTTNSILHRQAGGTVCAYRFALASGPADVELMLSADLSVDTAPRAFSCSPSGYGEAPASCGGIVVVGAGSARLLYAVPYGVSLPQGADAAQALLSAASAALEAPGALRAIPTVTAGAMGAGVDDCLPSAVQRDAVFSQVDVAYQPDVYGQPLGYGVTEQRLDAFGCWWWFGWEGISVSVVPGAGWVVGEPGVLGTPVAVDGAQSALRVETPYLENGGGDGVDKVIVRLLVSARGSAVVLEAYARPDYVEYFRERMIGVAEAIVATQP